MEMIFIKINLDKPPNNVTILVPKSLISNLEISHYSITVYCLIKKLLYFSNENTLCLTIPQLTFYLTGEIPIRRNSLCDHLQQGLSDLIENDYIELETIQQKHYLLNCEKLWFDTGSETFVSISYDEVVDIFKINGVNNHRLLRYYIFLIGTFNGNLSVKLSNGVSKKGVVSDMGIGYLSEQTDISQKTIMDYNRLLEQSNLIYIYRFTDFICSGDVLKNSHNIYGRYKDKEYVDAYVKMKQKRNGNKSNSHIGAEEVNDKRSLAQIYRNICAGKADGYSKRQIMRAYSYICSENEKYEKLYDETRNTTYLNKIRDASIFKDYLTDFYFNCNYSGE